MAKLGNLEKENWKFGLLKPKFAVFSFKEAKIRLNKPKHAWIKPKFSQNQPK